jgi:hypothetical protein
VGSWMMMLVDRGREGVKCWEVLAVLLFEVFALLGGRLYVSSCLL